ncbi:hypothetical protein SKAU_G00021140 [Synaphobranchus kaupii]|uniref:Uncharacterized protein n=1 Tax=Synaphobranchus kaupii TaxID=118154 RepID=A0A9Q1GD34_SYNKA|nr:hypothetical protein SKAU_G00021140 [Synaphobranchus kaupii]
MALVHSFPCLKDNTGSGYHGALGEYGPHTPGRNHKPATGFLEECFKKREKTYEKSEQTSSSGARGEPQILCTRLPQVPPHMIGYLQSRREPQDYLFDE